MKNTDKTSKQFKKMARAFISDESGQTTTEYVLLLLMVVVAVKMVGGTLQKRLQKVVEAAFGKADDAINDSGGGN